MPARLRNALSGPLLAPGGLFSSQLLGYHGLHASRNRVHAGTLAFLVALNRAIVRIEIGQVNLVVHLMSNIALRANSARLV